MSNSICPVCGTGSCQFRDGIMCRSWVCAEGIYKGTSGHKGVDKMNTAYQQSEGAKDISSFQDVMDFFNNACKGGFRQ